jgi:hypothetical protein
MEKKSMIKKGLIVFLRKPVLGQVKTRLAKDLGEEKTLKVYEALVLHTLEISKNQDFDVIPYYFPEIPSSHAFQDFECYVQSGKDLGEAMHNAFDEMFSKGYEQLVIIGSDCFQLSSSHLKKSFDSLQNSEYVIGPAKDGGYYLLGMKALNQDLFKGIEWSTSNVFQHSIQKLKEHSVHVLQELNDIDDINDLLQENDLKHFAN